MTEQLYDEAFRQMGQAPLETDENTGPKRRGRRPGAAYGKWGGGAQPKPPEQKAKPITITLPPDLIAWLDSLGPKRARSTTVTRLLRASKEYLAQE